jgi:hypothetical protein
MQLLLDVKMLKMKIMEMEFTKCTAPILFFSNYAHSACYVMYVLLCPLDLEIELTSLLLPSLFNEDSELLFSKEPVSAIFHSR